MAAPNIKDPAAIYSKTATYRCTDTLASAFSNPAVSGKVCKVNTIKAANIDGLVNVEVDVSLFRSSTHTYQAYKVVVPAASALLVVTKDECLNVEEGDAIYARSSTTQKIDLTINYEEIS